MQVLFTRAASTFSLLFFAALLSSACGSSDDSEDGGLGANGSNAGTAGSTGIDINGNGGNGTGTGTNDGGTVELTPDDVAAIADAACAGWTTEGENLPAVLQLVVDVSGSMEDAAPGTNDSKWDVTRAALDDAIATLPASVSLGVLYYPNQDAGQSTTPRDVSECVNVGEMVPIDLLGGDGAAQRDLVEQSLQDANTGSLTPTHDAYRYALENGLVPYQTSARKFMLLITDGAPTMALECIGTGGGRNGGMVMDAPTQPIIDEIAGAYEQGIRTFLIGSPGSEESSQGGDDMRPWLSQAAIEGGTAATNCEVDGPNFCHMDMTQEPDFGQALSDGLASIVGQVVDSCTFVVPPPPSGQALDPGLTNLIINWTSGSSSLVLPDDIGDCSEGWQFDADGQVVLCAATCEQVKADAGATVQLTFGCSTNDIIPVR